MIEGKSFLRELDDAVLRGSEESRTKALWYATDMLIVGHYTEKDTWVFGEVIGQLAGTIEVAARAQLAKRLANIPNAPISALHRLAFDGNTVSGLMQRRWSETSGARASGICSPSPGAGPFPKS